MDALSEKYLEDVRAVLPLGRMLLLLLAFLSCVLAHGSPSRGLLVETIAVRLTSLTFNQDATLATAMVGDLMFAASLVCIAYFSHRALVRMFVRWLWARIDLKARAQRTVAAFPDWKTLDSTARAAALARAQSDASKASKECSALSELSLLLGGYAAVLMLFSGHFPGHDCLFALVFLAISMLVQARAVMLYLATVMPHRLLEASLTGQSLELIFEGR